MVQYNLPIVQQPQAIFWANLVSSDIVFFLRIIYLLDVYNKIQVGVEFYLGQFEKFKVATNVTENQPIIQNKTSNTNKMLFTMCSNMRSIMVLLVLCKVALFT